MFLFLFYSFGIETINTFIHSRSCLENHARLQTKMGKVYTCFQSKTAQKPYALGRYLYGLLREYPHPPPPLHPPPPPLRILSVQDRASRAAHSIASTFSALYTLYRHARCSYSIKINIIDINRSFNSPTNID